MSNETQNAEDEILDRAVAMLGEHFDAVEILVTRDSTGSSQAKSKGCGNWYSRYGLAREYVVRADEQMRIERRQQSEE